MTRYQRLPSESETDGSKDDNGRGVVSWALGLIKSYWKPVLFVLSVGLNIFLGYYFKDFNKKSPKCIIGKVFKEKSLENDTILSLESDTILLIWLWPFGNHFDLNSCSSKFNIDGCYLTADRDLYSKAHGVLINHRDIKTDLSNLPTQPRPFFQKWIWMHFESPQNTRRLEGLENLFNVTINYRRDADIVLREQIMFKSDGSEDEIFPQVLDKKDKLVCWIVSNWNDNHKRVKYYNELKQHIDIYALGRHFGKAIGDDEYKKTLTRCKFYLSFENTDGHYDYMTEKLFNPLKLGSVPVALGAPRYIYERFVPKDAFIHIDDFSSPKELAEHLLSLDKNVTEYKKYFLWRKHFDIKSVDYPEEHACRTCQYIRNHKYYQVFVNLNKWYFGGI
ncbi:4-galactosyl-N-acetylglucosaminide 3-alpha-L-fucosyltransferase 9-like [Xyrauchen texanus]|uniref:4-galactosyl-N-acetylglucosaminide 3-alpha-L-fucosyltransferase 9-like n=1 Tax=Xyrauchen texanus TaxID=154827 RepID=UPI0022418971|nr:4-galactosyl-N-acetylglucosaminide 3-alpha-L-fucosyltransferase 9-like [Xyrauchen texanus]